MRIVNARSELAKSLARRAHPFTQKHPIAIVVAKCEYETWFLASLSTVVGQSWTKHTGLPAGLSYHDDVEELVAVKGWLSRQLPRGNTYKPTTDQIALTQLIDVDLAKQNSRSFRRLCHAVEEIVDAIDNQQKIVTPAP